MNLLDTLLEASKHPEDGIPPEFLPAAFAKYGQRPSPLQGFAAPAMSPAQLPDDQHDVEQPEAAPPVRPAPRPIIANMLDYTPAELAMIRHQRAMKPDNARISFAPSTEPEQEAPVTLGGTAKALSTGVVNDGILGLLGLLGDTKGLMGQFGDYVGDKMGLKPLTPEMRQAIERPRPFGLPDISPPTSADLTRSAERLMGTQFYRPQNRTERYAESIGSFLPAMVGGGGSLLARLARVALPGLLSEAAAEATRGTQYETPARIAGGVAGFMLPGAAGSTLRGVGNTFTDGRAASQGIEIIPPRPRTRPSGSVWDDPRFNRPLGPQDTVEAEWHDIGRPPAAPASAPTTTALSTDLARQIPAESMQVLPPQQLRPPALARQQRNALSTQERPLGVENSGASATLDPDLVGRMPTGLSADTLLPSRASGLFLETQRSKLRNPRPTEPIPFEHDYPDGAPADDKGNLTWTAGGQRITAPNVAGRQTVGGPNVNLTYAQTKAIIEHLFGKIYWQNPEEIPGMNGNYVIPVEKIRGDRRRGTIAINNALSKAVARQDMGHELGHGIDHIAGKYLDRIPNEDGVPQNVYSLFNLPGIDQAEIKQIYHDTNVGLFKNPPKDRLITPEDSGYSQKMAPLEYMAETLRVALQHSNYFKTVAPKSAPVIRDWINTHPVLRHIVQLNALPGMIGAPLAWKLLRDRMKPDAGRDNDVTSDNGA